jgi:YHS domain-containing protein
MTDNGVGRRQLFSPYKITNMYKPGLTLIFITVAFCSFAQDATGLRQKHFNLDEGVAIKGYDPVAYFLQDKAVKGKKDWSTFYQGVTYYFASASDRDEFKKDPSRYEPQYGGWCAFAMGKDGSKVDVDPGTFKITGGKLFLFYNQFFTNTLKSWNKDEVSLHGNADSNWQKLYH